MTELVTGLREKDRRSIARAITTMERGGPEATALQDAIHAHTGRAFRLGITGPPGAGKSTLLVELVKALRKRGSSTGVIAVDPTSPYSQGAVLGDRVRMVELEDDNGVYIRSMASRGKSGGLSAKTADALDVLDVAGFDLLLLESVGVGQVELAIEPMVDTTLVVLVPESGDQVQAIKAGLMEIADIYIVNKSDRPGSNAALQAIQSAISTVAHHSGNWMPKALPTVATEATGIGEVIDEIDRHRGFLETAGSLEAKRNTRMQNRVKQIVTESLQHDVWNEQRDNMLTQLVSAILNGEVSPLQAAQKLLDDFYRDKAP